MRASRRCGDLVAGTATLPRARRSKTWTAGPPVQEGEPLAPAPCRHSRSASCPAPSPWGGAGHRRPPIDLVEQAREPHGGGGPDDTPAPAVAAAPRRRRRIRRRLPHVLPAVRVAGHGRRAVPPGRGDARCAGAQRPAVVAVGPPHGGPPPGRPPPGPRPPAPPGLGGCPR